MTCTVYFGSGEVSFSANNGVHVDGFKTWEEMTPERLFEWVALAREWMVHPLLVEACCGGGGPLADAGYISFDRFREIIEDEHAREVTRGAKRFLTKSRRAEFNANRDRLALQLIESGVLYVCAWEGCGIDRDLHVDHKLALSRGGSDGLANLQFLCPSHNAAKGDRGAPTS